MLASNINSNAGLTENQLRFRAPAIFTQQPHESVSGKYQFLSTLEVIERLRELGWVPHEASQSTVRNPERRLFTRHLVRFKNINGQVPELKDGFPELVLRGSHDGRAATEFFAGVFRIVCSNGMIVQSQNFGRLRQRHVGQEAGRVIDGVCELVEELPRQLQKVVAFRQIELNPREQEAFAGAALVARWGDPREAPVMPQDLLKARRISDIRSDLWHTFQRVQENLMKGGLHGQAKTGRNLTTRPIKSVDANVKLNQALWLLTERMAELKN